MSSSRENILKRLSAAGRGKGESGGGTASRRGAHGPVLNRNLVEVFTTALEKVGGKAVVTGRAGLSEALSKIFSPADRVYVGDDVEIDRTAPAGYCIDTDPARCDAAITGCDALIAETGSVILSGGTGRRRISSLITRTHCVVADDSRCIATLEDYFRRLDAGDPAWSGNRSVLTMITGSSRTADIEKVLILGMHGPSELVVVIIQEKID